MRITFNRFTSSFAALLTRQNSLPDMQDKLECIRSAMHCALSELGLPANGLPAKTGHAIARASDIQTLWYLRSDLLWLIADARCEAVARKQLDHITEMFRGTIPGNQMSDPKRLRRLTSIV
jgi:hypothetical protein